jgi:hypothetical protein
MIRGLLTEFGIDIPKSITNALAFVRRSKIVSFLQDLGPNRKLARLGIAHIWSSPRSPAL